MNNSIVSTFKALDKINNTNVLLINGQLKTFEQLVVDLQLIEYKEQAILQLILSYALKSEQLIPGSLLEFIQALSKAFKEKSDGNHVKTISLTETVTSAHLTWDQLIGSTLHLLQDVTLSSILAHALELAGLHGRIFIERSPNNCSFIEMSQGYVFDVSINSAKHKTTLSNVKVITIEGYVETVAELNTIFQQLAETKEACIIFARGFTDDVFSTVHTNNVRGTLNVVLAVVPFELRGINMLNDISIASGASLVSTNLGNLISTTTLDKAGFFKKVLISSNSITCVNSKTSRAVHLHVQELLKKSQDAEVDDIKDLINLRIKSLISTSVTIKLIDDKNFVRNSLLLDKSLRLIKSLISYGMLNNEPAVKLLFKKTVFACLASIQNLGDVV